MITGGEQIWLPPRHGEIVMPPLEAYTPRWDRRGVSRRGGRGGAQEFTPFDAGFLGWWRADLGITLDGSSNVQVWANQGTAGSALDASQGTAGSRPLYNATDANFNGQATVQGDGARWLDTAVTTALDKADGEDLVVIAILRHTAAGDDYFFGSNGTSGNGRSYYEVDDSPASRWIFVDSTGAATTLSGPACTTNAVSVCVIECRGAATPSTDALEYAIDGTSPAVSDLDTRAIAPGANGRIWQLLGARSGSVGGYFVGQVAEIMARKARLSAEEKTGSMLAYINGRYGLALARLLP